VSVDDELNRILGGTKVRFQITAKGREELSKIANIFKDKKNLSVTRADKALLIRKFTKSVKKELRQSIQEGAEEYAPELLAEKLTAEILELFRDKLNSYFRDLVIKND